MVGKNSIICLGGVAAHVHVLSETSQRLFQKAIVVSASALNPWALTTENHFRRCVLFGKDGRNSNDCFCNLTFFLLLAEEHGVYTNNTNEIISFLQTSDASIFFDMNSIMWSGGFENNLNELDMPWAPVVERK